MFSLGQHEEPHPLPKALSPAADGLYRRVMSLLSIEERVVVIADRLRGRFS